MREIYYHLRGLPLSNLEAVRPVLLIRSDYPHLIPVVEPIRLGPPGGPAAIKTRLGWTLQGPVQHLQHEVSGQQCLFTSMSTPEIDLLKQVERLWQIDVLPWQSEKMSTRSRQDQEAMKILESKTVRLEVDGVKRYATPVLCVKHMPDLKAPKNTVLPHLRAIERRLAKDPKQVATYTAEIKKNCSRQVIQARYWNMLEHAHPTPGTFPIIWSNTTGRTGLYLTARFNIRNKTSKSSCSLDLC